MGEWLEALAACFHGYPLSARDLTAPSPTPYVGVRLGNRSGRGEAARRGPKLNV